MTLKEKAILAIATIIFMIIFCDKFLTNESGIERTTITLTNEDLGAVNAE